MNLKLNFRQVGLFVILTFLSATLSFSAIGILVSVTEIFCVLYFAFKGKLESAVFWHFVFLMTSFKRVGGESYDIHNDYINLKLFGPITFSYLVAAILYLKCRYQYSYPTNLSWNIPRKVLTQTRFGIFFLMYKYFVYFFLVGTLLGLFGLFFCGYFLEEFISYLVYITIIIIHIEILLRLTSERFISKCYDASLSLLLSGLVFTVLCECIGISDTYGAAEITVLKDSPVAPYIPILLLLFTQFKNRLILISFFLIYIVLLITNSASGKFFANISLMLILYFVKLVKINKVGLKLSIPLSLIGVLLISVSSLKFGEQFNNKLDQFTSIFNLFSGNEQDIRRSPYIRIASMSNIYKENLSNPIWFFCGRGYGGYFEDDNGLLSKVDLYDGGFKSEYIQKGKYPTAHSTSCVVPLLHGFGGFFLILYIIFCYLKQSIKGSYLNAAASIWLLHMLYYNLGYGVIGLFFLYSAEYKYYENDNAFTQN